MKKGGGGCGRIREVHEFADESDTHEKGGKTPDGAGGKEWRKRGVEKKRLAFGKYTKRQKN